MPPTKYRFLIGTELLGISYESKVRSQVGNLHLPGAALPGGKPVNMVTLGWSAIARTCSSFCLAYSAG